MKKSSLTEDKAEQTPTGGVLVGKRQGQTIIHNKGTLSGYLVGKTHAEGGIKAVNKSTGQALEMQGGEVVITAPAVSDNTKNEFNGKMMTNREILSTINEKGGGVSFAKGGDIPKNIKRTGASYKYGGKTMTDHEIYKKITGGHLAEGMTLTQIAKKHKVSVKELQKQVDMGMKAESEHTSSKREQMKIVKDHLFENPKYYTLLKKAGLKHGGAVRRGSLVRDAKRGNTPARDLNNYNDVLDLDADGVVGAETGLYARGGKVKTYDDGGSVKEEVEYITIGNQSSNPYIYLEKVKFYNFIDFKIFIKDLYAESGATNKREVFLCINNDDSTAKFGVSVSQGKNTNSNFNPFTGTFKDLEKNLQKFSVGNFDLFDWNRWGGVKTAKTTASKTSVPTSRLFRKDDLYDSKIWIGNDLDLRDRLIDRLQEIGIPLNSNYGDVNLKSKKGLYIEIFDNDYIVYDDGLSSFEFSINNEIFESDLKILNTATVYSASEIKLFKEIEKIINDNNLDKVENPISEWENPNSNFSLIDDETGEVLKFRFYKKELGVQKEDVNKNNAKKILKIYINWKKTQSINGSSATTTATQTSVPTSKVLTKDELYDSRIWIGDDLDLRDKVIAKLIEIGIPEDADYGNKGYTKDLYIKIYGKDFVLWSEVKSYFDSDDRKEIFASDLGININNVGATPTSTATISGIYNASEIKLFQEIDEIIKGNNLKPLENPIIEWSDGVSTKEFVLLNDKTNELFNLRSYNVTLGVQEEDTNKDRAKGLLKIYINWKATQTIGGVSSTTINANNAIEVSRLTRNDLSNVKIWLGNNPELSEKIQKRAFELGLKWVDGDLRVTELDAPCLIFNGSGNTDNRIEKRASKSLFDNVNLEEIFVTDSTTTATPTSVPFDLKLTAINVNRDKALAERVIKRAEELGWIDNDAIIRRINDDVVPEVIWFDEQKYAGWSDKDFFYFNKLYKEIFESDLFGTFTTTTSLPIDLTKTKIWIGDNPALSEKIQKRAMELGWDWWSGDGTPKFLDYTNLFFDINNKITSASDRTNFDSFTDFKEITEADLFGTTTPISLTATTSGKFTTGEINAFKQIDEIVTENKFTNVSISEWSAGDKTQRFFVQNTDTKEEFILRSYINDLGISVPSSNELKAKKLIEKYLEWKKNQPTSVPFDLTKTKIWIGDNPTLSEKIQKRAFELGWTLFGVKDVNRTDEPALYFDVQNRIGWFNDRKDFDNYPSFKEITESDLFGTTSSQTSTQNAPVEDEDWVKKFTADLDKLVVPQNDEGFVGGLSKEHTDLNALIQLLPSFQQSKYAIERAKILKEIKKLHYKLTYEGFIKPNEKLSSDADLFTPQGLLDYYFTQATQNPTAELEPACELPTPNGEKSKLPMSAYLNVRTEQFKNWFGDWEKAYENGNYVNCSKMIDPDTKEPKIYFHGVRKYVPNFGQFSNMGQGVVRPYGAFEPPTFPASYFAGEEDYAKFYGGVAENLPTPSADYKPFIYKVFLSVKNPISLLPLDFMLSYKDFMDYIYVGYGVKVEPNQELLKVLNNDITKKNPMWIYVRRDIGFIEKLKDYGYDAIFQMGDIPTFLPSGEVEPDRTKHLQEVEYLTFNPSQVKSATVKKSFYFDFFNDIRFKNGGYVRI